MSRLAACLWILAGSGGIAILKSQNSGAPTVDRIGFPTDYDKNFTLLYTFDRPDTGQVRTIYANREAATILNAKSSNSINFPYGSVLVMETWRARRNTANQPDLDANGRYQKDPAAAPTLFVMKKDRGFGEAYGPNRNGEWEYVAYRADGSYQNRPETTASCAVCHLQAGALQDWTMRVLPLTLRGESGAVPNGMIHNYRFVPGEIRIKAGQFVTFQNTDATVHTIADDTVPTTDVRVEAGKTMTFRFTEPGEFNFHCSIHPSMRGKVVVEQ